MLRIKASHTDVISYLNVSDQLTVTSSAIRNSREIIPPPENFAHPLAELPRSQLPVSILVQNSKSLARLLKGQNFLEVFGYQVFAVGEGLQVPVDVECHSLRLLLRSFLEALLGPATMHETLSPACSFRSECLLLSWPFTGALCCSSCGL